MDAHELQEAFEALIPGLAAEAEVGMSAHDRPNIDKVYSEIVAYERILQDVAASLVNMKHRINCFRTSGDPDVIIKAQNDF